MKFSWKTIQKPIVALAPMDGYSDSAFRQLIKQIEPRTICFTEFISSDFLAVKPKDFKKFLSFNPSVESPLVVQLFGKKPEHFALAAKIAEDAGAAAIDINMGCPAKKVVSSMHGAYLMKNVQLGCKIIDAVKKQVSIPVSVKTRLGWEDDTNLIPFVKSLIDSGIDMITIHGRTYKQAFHGKAQWDAIYKLKEAVPIPVMGNGDVIDALSAKQLLGNLDGVMIGRACFGNPWIFRDVANALISPLQPTNTPISWQEKLAVMWQHANLLVQTKGDYKGLMESRKHMALYIRDIPRAANFRSRLVHIASLLDLQQILEEIKRSVGGES